MHPFRIHKDNIMTKHAIREETFKALFTYEFYSDKEEAKKELETFVNEDKDIAGEYKEEILFRLYRLLLNIDEIDLQIENTAHGWTIKRMNRADLALMRLAVFEMQHENLTPGIAINEAVELAKEYGTDDSARFINGILGKIVKDRSDGN